MQNALKSIAFILFGILLIHAAVFLLIWDPWIPIIESAAIFEIILVLTGLIMGIIGVTSASKIN